MHPNFRRNLGVINTSILRLVIYWDCDIGDVGRLIGLGPFFGLLQFKAQDFGQNCRKDVLPDQKPNAFAVTLRSTLLSVGYGIYEASNDHLTGFYFSLQIYKES